MTGLEMTLYVVGAAIVLATILAFSLRKNGYSFRYYFVTGFIASCGVLGIVFKIINDYL